MSFENVSTDHGVSLVPQGTLQMWIQFVRSFLPLKQTNILSPIAQWPPMITQIPKNEIEQYTFLTEVLNI